MSNNRKIPSGKRFYPLIYLRSTNFLKVHLKVAKLFGLYPFGADHATSDSTNFSNIYLVLLLGTLFILSVWTGYQRILITKKLSTIFETILHAIEISLSCIFIASVMITNVLNIRSWQKLLENLSLFDKNCREFISACQNETRPLIKMVICHITILVLSIHDQVIWAQESSFGITDLLLFFPQHIGIFFEYGVDFLICEITSVLQSRYEYLEDKLENILLNTMANHKFTKRIFDKEIESFKLQYKVLYTSVKYVNTIFGVVILSLIGHFIMLPLVNFYWSFILIKGKSIVTVIGMILFHEVVITVS